MAEPAEVAAAIVFLASPLASHSSGTSIEVCGGMEGRVLFAPPPTLAISAGEATLLPPPQPARPAAPRPTPPVIEVDMQRSPVREKPPVASRLESTPVPAARINYEERLAAAAARHEGNVQEKKERAQQHRERVETKAEQRSKEEEEELSRESARQRKVGDPSSCTLLIPALRSAPLTSRPISVSLRALRTSHTHCCSRSRPLPPRHRPRNAGSTMRC